MRTHMNQNGIKKAGRFLKASAQSSLSRSIIAKHLLLFVAVFLLSDSILWSQPMALWQFEGNVLTTPSGAYDGTPVNSPGFSPGKVGQALSLDGTSQYVTIPFLLNPATGDFTVDAWIQCSGSTGSDQTILSQADGGGTGRSWLYRNDATGNLCSNLGNSGLTSIIPINMATWYHVALVYIQASSTLKIYVNGVMDNFMVITAESCPGSMLIGSDQAAGTFLWKGLIDELEIYNTALLDMEIQTLYCNGLSPIEKEPTVSILQTTGTNPMCQGAMAMFTATPFNEGMTPSYQWKINGLNVGSDMPTYSDIALVNGDIVTCEMTSSWGCASPPIAASSGINMIVDPLPMPITGINNVCMGSTTILSDATPAGTWSSGNPAVATINAGGTVTGVSPGPSNIFYTIIATGCAQNFMINVNPIPMISGPNNVCNGSVISLTGIPPGGIWMSTIPAVATINASGILTGVSAGTTTISYTDMNGCMGNYPVTVNPLPSAITGASAVCVGGTTVLSDVTPGGTWSSGTPAVATINAGGTVMGISPGSSVITYTLPTGCFITKSFTVNALPTITLGANPVICSGTITANLLYSATTASPNMYSIAFDAAALGAGFVTVTNAALPASPITVTVPGAAPAAMYNAMLTVKNGTTGCVSGNNAITITVNPFPMAAGAITGSSAVCQEEPLVSYSVPAITNAVSCLWTYSGTGANITGTTNNITIAFAANATSGNLTVLGVNGCGNGTASANYSITVNSLPDTIAGKLNVFVDSTITLTDATAGGTWSSATPSVATIDAAGLVTGVSPGSTDITYTSMTGCMRTVTVNVSGNIDATPPTIPSALSANNITATGFSISWTASSDNVGVTGYEAYNNITLIGSSSGTGTTMNITGLTPNTTFNVVLKAKDAAGNKSASSPLAVTTPKAILAVIADNKSRKVGAGNPALTFSYLGFVNGDNESVLTQKPVASTLADAASADCYYPITLSGGLSDRYDFSYISGILSVTPADCGVKATITNSSIPAICNGDSVTLTAAVEPGVIYQWYRDGSMIQSGTDNKLICRKAGKYFVTLSNATCVDFSATVTVPAKKAGPAPVIEIKSGAIGNCAAPGTVNLGTVDPYSSYEWNTGSVAGNIDVAKSGQYTVTVPDTSGCMVTSEPFEINASEAATPEICIVTVSPTTGKNIIVWKRGAGKIKKYKIYKETSTADVYALMDSAAYDAMNLVVDTNSDANVRSNRYKVSAVDSCDVESPLSKMNMSLHLTINYRYCGGVNLIWEKFEGLNIDRYVILEGNSASTMKVKKEISGNITSCTILDSLKSFYQIGIKVQEACLTSPLKAEAGPYTQSLSNIVEYKADPAGISAVKTKLMIYPNPASDAITVITDNPGLLTITDVSGRIIRQVNPASNETKLDVSDLAAGCYFISIQSADGVATSKLIIE